LRVSRWTGAVAARGLTASALARSSGAGVGTLRRFLDGEPGLSIVMFDKLADALGLDLLERKTTTRRAKGKGTDRAGSPSSGPRGHVNSNN
jgi:transcriptional regulator with XRE-family HTH domain